MPAHTRLAISSVCSLLAAVLIYGKIAAINGNQVTLDVTCGEGSGISGTVQVDATQAIQEQRSITLVVGRSAGLDGDMQGNIFVATAIFYATVSCQ